MARTYKRDSNGRFASTGGARSGRPAAKPVSRGRNRITRDNAGKITSVGGEGATARGGRLRTAAGNKRAVQTARIKGGGGRLQKPVGGGSGVANAVATRVSNRTKAEAGAAYRKRIKPARNAAAKMAPKDNKISLTAPSKNLILGKTWEQIQSAQRGAGRALSGGAITGKPVKPRATQSDRRLLLKKGKKGLQKDGLYGTLDRLKTSKVQLNIKKKAVTATKSAANTRKSSARVDGDAFAARAKRAKGAALRRGINESDRENAMSSAQRRATSTTKRFAASNQRQARSDRTAAAAQAFYRIYGSPSMFGQRPRQSTASSPTFGSKKRRRKPA